MKSDRKNCFLNITPGPFIFCSFQNLSFDQMEMVFSKTYLVLHGLWLKYFTCQNMNILVFSIKWLLWSVY